MVQETITQPSSWRLEEEVPARSLTSGGASGPAAPGQISAILTFQTSAQPAPNPLAMNTQGNGASDAAGLPLAPLILNAEEVIGSGTPISPNGVVQHPTRFTLDDSLGRYVWPAAGQPAEYGSCSGGYVSGNGLIVQPNSGPNQPPTSCTETTPNGEIFRLKASVYSSLPSCFSSSPQSMIIATGFAHYGIIYADLGNTGSVVLTNDSQWNMSDLACLNQLSACGFRAGECDGDRGGLGQQRIAHGELSDSIIIVDTTATPTFSPAAGTYTSTQTVTISPRRPQRRSTTRPTALRRRRARRCTAVRSRFRQQRH